MTKSTKKHGQASKVPDPLRKSGTAVDGVVELLPNAESQPPVSKPRPTPAWGGSLSTCHPVADMAPNIPAVMTARTTAELEAGEALVALLQGGEVNQQGI